MTLSPEIIADITARLTSLASSQRIELPGGQPESGEPVLAGVGPAIPDLEIAHLLAGAVDLNLLVDPITQLEKKVQFSDPRPETPVNRSTFEGLVTTGTGAQILNGTPLYLGGVTPEPGNQGLFSQLAGMTGRLTGTVPIPVKSTFPVMPEVTWKLLRTATGPELTPGTDYQAPMGLTGKQAAFVLPPLFVDTPNPVGRSVFIAAELVLKAAGVSSPRVPLPPVELKLPALPVRPLVQQLFQATLSSDRPDPAQAVQLLGTRTGVDNVLSRTAERLGARLELGYEVWRGDRKAQAGEVAGGLASGPLPLDDPRSLLLRPAIGLLSTATAGEAWSVKVYVKVSKVPGLPDDLRVDLPALPLAQLPVQIPNVALAFGGRHYGRPAGGRQGCYVFAAPGNPALDGVVINADSSHAVQLAMKAVITTQLTTARDLLVTLTGVFEDLVPHDQMGMFVDTLAKALAGLAGSQPGYLVFDGSARLDDFSARNGESGQGWEDYISSIVMVAPLSSRTLRLCEDDDWKGRSVRFAVPDERLIGSFWTIHESWGTDSVKLGDYEHERDDSFGNKASSFEWV